MIGYVLKQGICCIEFFFFFFSFSFLVICLDDHWENFHFDSGFVCNSCSLFLFLSYDVGFCE